MSPKQKLVSSSALAGFIGGLGSFVFLIRMYGVDSWHLIFAMSFEVSLLFPVGSSTAAAVIATRFDPKKFRWPQGMVLAYLSFLLFSVCRGFAIGVYFLFTGSSFWQAVGFMLIIPFSDVLFGTIFVGWIILPLGALLGFMYHSRFNKSLNTDTGDAGAG